MAIVTNIPKLNLIEKNRSQILETVLTNIVKMLTERKIINESNKNSRIKDTVNQDADDMTYKIKVDKTTDNDDKFYAIKIIPQKITAVNKATGISDFLNTFKNNPKIVIVGSISKKAKQSVAINYPKTEIFTEEELMINLVDYCLVPKYQILTPKERDEFYETYNLTKRNSPKILTSDPVAKYYNVKPGDILRISRPSITSGISPSYRLVVKGELNK
jgi:DNA-directed RNA polymerase subunit H (RpoH/RPB5)